MAAAAHVGDRGVACQHREARRHQAQRDDPSLHLFAISSQPLALPWPSSSLLGSTVMAIPTVVTGTQDAVASDLFPSSPGADALPAHARPAGYDEARD